MATKKPTQAMFEDEDQPKRRTTRRKTSQPKQDKEEPKQEYVPESDTSIESSTMVIDLPSGGYLWYPASITCRDILVKDEELLSTATTENYARTLNSVLKGILNDCDYYEKIAVNDRDWLLVWIWANNYSAIKEVELTCSNQECWHKSSHKVDLTKLDVNDLDENVKVPLKIPLSKQPGSAIEVRHNIVADEIEVEQFMTTKEGKQYEYDYLMRIASIDTGMKMPMRSKIDWVRENVTGKEMAFVRKYHDYFSFGVQRYVDYKCPACGEVTRGPLPFQAEDVLFPAAPDGFEELL